MYVAEIIFKRKGKPDKDADAEDIIYSALAALLKNGQLLNGDFLIAHRNKDYIAFVSLPDKDSLDNKYDSQWVRDNYATLEAGGFARPVIHLLGSALGTDAVCVCSRRNFFILFTTFLSMESPLRCGNCFGTVPLYTIPKKPNEDYNDILGWQSDYQSCDTLQMHCTTGERFGLREMSGFASSLSKQGRAVCIEIEKKTGKPAYYYLHRYNGISEKTERQRKCPSCKSDWLLKKPLHKIFDFRCNQCRLLSNIAWSVRP